MPITKATASSIAPAAKGDLVVGSATNDAAVLGVGSNDQVLTADSSTATGLKWAAVAGGAGNMAQIATGSLSGSSVTVSGLSNYTDILVFVYSITNASLDRAHQLRLNSTSTANYNYAGYTDYTYTTASYRQVGLGGTEIPLSFVNCDFTSPNNGYAIKLTNCKNPGFTDFDITGYANSTSGTINIQVKGVFTKSETISSLTFLPSGGTFAGGTYYIWGA